MTERTVAANHLREKAELMVAGDPSDETCFGDRL